MLLEFYELKVRNQVADYPEAANWILNHEPRIILISQEKYKSSEHKNYWQRNAGIGYDIGMSAHLNNLISEAPSL